MHISHGVKSNFPAGLLGAVGDPGWPVYADGEPQGTLPVTVHCQPGALTVVA